jgi:hypothetical protein
MFQTRIVLSSEQVTMNKGSFNETIEFILLLWPESEVLKVFEDDSITFIVLSAKAQKIN